MIISFYLIQQEEYSVNISYLKWHIISHVYIINVIPKELAASILQCLSQFILTVHPSKVHVWDIKHPHEIYSESKYTILDDAFTFRFIKILHLLY